MHCVIFALLESVNVMETVFVFLFKILSPTKTQRKGFKVLDLEEKTKVKL